MGQEVEISVNVKMLFRCGRKFLYIRLPDGYNLPGGHLDQGETVDEALRRELKEEMDYDLQVAPKLVGVWSDHRKTGEARILIGYTIELPTEQPFTYIPDPVETTGELVWVDLDELPVIKMNPRYDEFVRQSFRP